MGHFDKNCPSSHDTNMLNIFFKSIIYDIITINDAIISSNCWLNTKWHTVFFETFGNHYTATFFFFSENNELWIKYKKINLAQRKWECKKCKKRMEKWKVKKMESAKNNMVEPASIVNNG